MIYRFWFWIGIRTAVGEQSTEAGAIRARAPTSTSAGVRS